MPQTAEKTETESDSEMSLRDKKWKKFEEALDEHSESDEVSEEIREAVEDSLEDFNGEFANPNVLKVIATRQRDPELKSGLFGVLSDIDRMTEDGEDESRSRRRSGSSSSQDPYSNSKLVDRMKSLDEKFEYASGGDGDRYVDKGWIEDGFVGVKRFLNRKPELRSFFFYIYDKPRTKEEVLEATEEIERLDEESAEELWDDFTDQWYLELHGWGLVEADEDDMPDDFDGDMEGRMKITNLKEAVESGKREFTNNFDWSDEDVESLPFT